MTRRPILTIDVACPECWAAPGERCSSFNPYAPYYYPSPHAARVAAVAADDGLTEPSLSLTERALSRSDNKKATP